MFRCITFMGLVALLGSLGCQSCPCDDAHFVPDVPRELSMVTHPTYTIAAPDILLVDAIRVVPLPPYKLSPMDAVAINVPKALPNEPLQGVFTIEPDGGVNLGASYGKVTIIDKTVDEAKVVLENHLKTTVGLTDP
ncbi:MAG TPA: hypothetical protein PKD72_15780, partial [Gemmatales bacterium]|nr:hypothetical protein [Gemmatales bacterium]